MNPYSINPKKLKRSRPVTDEKELLKYQLVASLADIIVKHTSEEIIKKTGLHKADLSRLKALNGDRFSIDRLISLIHALGYSMTLKIKKA